MNTVYTDLEIKQDIIYPFPNKDTKLYGSFAKEAGNKGCEFFNNAFKKHGINAIYKSFSVNSIEKVFEAAKILNFAGFAVASPFKTKIVSLSINLNPSHYRGAANTIVRDDHYPNGEYFGYNTDYIGAKQIIKNRRNDYDKIYIIGTGGLSIAVQQAAQDLGFEKVIVINRKSWGILDDLQNQLIYNCTPLDITGLSKNNTFIDCRVGTPDGDELYYLQAKAQFKLYTGIDYE